MTRDIEKSPIKAAKEVKKYKEEDSDLLGFFTHTREVITLNDEEWEAFNKALDSLRPNPRLKKLLSTPSVFENNNFDKDDLRK